MGGVAGDALVLSRAEDIRECFWPRVIKLSYNREQAWKSVFCVDEQRLDGLAGLILGNGQTCQEGVGLAA